MEDESAASLAATLVNEEGHDPARVFVLKDGLAGWEAAGLPTAMEPPPGS
ncbi:MAG: hypothetical protein M3O91_01375 [Chloroflexota bacterium]|nr:hypothetical protein [Chloroflexota bacterium]